MHAPACSTTARLAFLGILCLALLASSDARAVSLLVDERFVHSRQVGCFPFLPDCFTDWDERQEPSSPFAPFAGDVENVTQTSSVGPLSFTAVGQAYHYYDAQSDYLNRDVSDFSIVFSLSSPQDYHAVFTYGQNALLGLQNLDTGDFVSLGGEWDGYETVGDTTGQLAPGTYRLQARAEEGDLGQNPGFYDLTFAIPEPASAVLVALGLLALDACRRRRTAPRRAGSRAARRRTLPRGGA